MRDVLEALFSTCFEKKGGICMDFLADPVILARIQFAFTAMYHFLLVPVSIGLGLIMAIYETRAYRSGKEEDAAAARF